MNETQRDVHYVENPEYHKAYVNMTKARQDLSDVLESFQHGLSNQQDVDAAWNACQTAEADFNATPKWLEYVG